MNISFVFRIKVFFISRQGMGHFDISGLFMFTKKEKMLMLPLRQAFVQGFQTQIH